MITSTKATMYPPLSRIQLRKLRSLLRGAYRNVTYYENLYREVDIRRIDGHSFQEIPFTSKTDLLSCELKDRIDRRLSVDQLATESTTGSTGRPFTLCVDERYRRKRNFRFLGALLDAGFRPWHRMMLITDRYAAPERRFGLWHYESAEQPTAAMYDAYVRIRPAVLYGFTTPLRLLADFARDRVLPLPQLVVTTAEMLDRRTRQTLESTFQCPVRDFYGMTEMGLVAWQDTDSATYSLASNSVLTEFIPEPGTDGRYRLIMTNLDLHACPMIRFDTGDSATVRNVGTQPEIVAFEGRQIDALVGRDGSERSPYVVTDALREVPGLRQFQVVQHELLDIRIDLVVQEGARENAIREVRGALEQLLGTGINLDIRFRDNLTPDGAQKFRPVQSRLVRR